jgi:hypothetical protein
MSADLDNPEARFRRHAACAIDEICRLRVTDEAMAALFRVIQKGRRKAASEAERGRVPE